MSRMGLRPIVLVLLLAAGCASGEDTATIPTVPTAPTPPSGSPPPPPPPNTSCLPGAASNLISTLSGNTRTLTWTAGANATDHDVHIGSVSGASDLVRENTTQTIYTWTGAGSGTSATFYARVHSHNACGSGPSSAELVFH